MKVWLVFQEIDTRATFLGSFSTATKAIERIEHQVEQEPDEDYRQVDTTLWYGKSRMSFFQPSEVDREYK